MKKPNNIKRLREAKGLTLAQLGKLVGVAKGYVSRWENYEKEDAVALTHRFILELCRALECSPDDIMIAKEAPNKQTDRLKAIRTVLEEYLAEKNIQLTEHNKSIAIGSFNQTDDMIDDAGKFFPISKREIALVVNILQENKNEK